MFNTNVTSLKVLPAAFLMCSVFMTFCSKKSSEETVSRQVEKKMADSSRLVVDTTKTTHPQQRTVEQAEVTESSKRPDRLEPVAKNEAAPELVALDIKLPKPMFVGTPQNMRVPRLEKPLGRPRPPFLAPAGTKNVAPGKPLACTDDAPIIGEIEMITDGDREAADGSYVELGPFLQHLTIDLGAMHEIYAILFWHYHKQPRIYFDVIVQVADDVDFLTNVRTLFNNDHDNSAGLGVGQDLHYVETSEGKLVDARGVQARYIRLYSNGNNNNDLNHYIEVEVYGKPVPVM